MASISNMSAMTRDRSTWPAAKAKARKRKRERKAVARKGQDKRDQEQLRRAF